VIAAAYHGSVNTVSTHQRKYRLKARADRQRQTRDRIVAATVALHREVGPARTTIADVARRAGVQRLTVYNNFPEISDLLSACQGHFLAGNPPPNIAPGASRAGALDRLEAALADLYRWYRANEAMERNVNRDRHLVPELDALMRKNADPPLDAASTAYSKLIAGSRAAAPSLRALIRLAFEFRTWQVLADQGMSDKKIAKLLQRAVAGLRTEDMRSRSTVGR
jgi:AcrR family transcriptional regulator